MKVEFSKDSAWRAIYVIRVLNDEFGRVDRHQFFHLSVDPTDARGPSFSGSFIHPFKRGRPGQRFFFAIHWRFKLPHLRWRSAHERRFLPGYLTLWRISNRFWTSLDGRRSYRAAKRADAEALAAQQKGT